MKTIKDYKDEMNISHAKLKKVIVWADYRDIDGFKDNLLKQFRNTIELNIKNEYNISVNANGFFDEPRIEDIANKRATESIKIILNSIDSSSDFKDSSIIENLGKKLFENINWFENKELNTLLPFLVKKFYFFLNVSIVKRRIIK